jgi:Sulfotransferase family
MIIGTERSGSNLLRLILNAHSAIAVPHPPHFMRYLGPLEASYGDLSREDRRRAATRDALRLLRTHIHPWEHPIDEDAVVAAASPTMFGITAAIYEEYRRARGKPRWGCKSTFMVDHVDDVLAEYPAARFIWLVRDPRDVAASAKHAVFGPYHPYLMATLWLRQQQRAQAALDRHGPGVVHRLRYEDLVGRPEQEIDKLCAFLEEPFEPAMVQPHRTGAARRTARLSASWRNTGEPISERSVGRYEKALTPAERRQVERVAGPLMERLGYRTRTDGPLAVRPSPLALRTRDARLRVVTEYRSLRNDANHARRWRRDATVRWLWLRARLRTLGTLAPARALGGRG